MANELRHGSVGTALSQAEWEAVGTHILNSQATGDIIYAASSSQLSRLGKATDGNILQLASGLPAWTASPTIGSTSWANATHAHAASNSGGTLTTLGTIATGVWQATDVGVAYGGTGVSTLTANGVLIGNGTSAIASVDMSTKGHILIGDGSGNPQMLAIGTNAYVLTADSGETTGVKWATASTVAAAGTLTGSTLASGVTASSLTSLGTIATGVWQGTDVGVAYGGTGASTLTANGVLIGNGSSAIASVDMSTKGHVLIGDGSGNPQMLGVGTNDHVLTADSGETTGVKWAAAAAAAGSLTGSTLASGVTASSLTSVGTIASDIQLNADLDFVGAQAITTTAGALTITPTTYSNFSSGSVYINETSNANQTVGLTVNQGANDDMILCFKSSDINTGMTTAPPNATVEVDDYASFEKMDPLSGGLIIESLAENAATGGLNFMLEAIGGGESTATSTSARGLVEFYASLQDGSNGLADIANGGNVFTVRARSGGGDATRFIVKGDGELHAGNTTVGSISDAKDDVMLTRALDIERDGQGVKGLIRSKWDTFVRENRTDLYEAGVLGEDSDDGLLSIQGLAMLHNGAIWQQAVKLFEMAESLAKEFPQLEGRFKKAGILPQEAV
jgi:hypothetical protein